MKNKKILISLIILFAMIFIQNKSNAAVAINGGTEWTSITASDCYAACYNMRNGSTSTLGSNNLDPHLALNADWGAVVYLGTSDYGSINNNQGGPSIGLSSANGSSNLSSTNYYSTTGNASGVMDLGYKSCYVSSIVTTYDGSVGMGYVKNIYNNLSSKYVESLDLSLENQGKAIGETQKWFSSGYSIDSSNYRPILYRSGTFGISYSNSSPNLGDKHSSNTFRPVIWNK